MVKSDCSTAFLAGIIAVAVSGTQWIPNPLGLRLLGVWATAKSSLAGLVWPKAKTSKNEAHVDQLVHTFGFLGTDAGLSHKALQQKIPRPGL